MLGKPMKLGTLPVLRVKNTQMKTVQPCVLMMSQLLNCWASNGELASVCKAIQVEYLKCVDAPVSKQKTMNNINYHALRLLPKLTNQKRLKDRARGDVGR